jgi:hypothetical protein
MGARYVLQYQDWMYFFSQLTPQGSGANNCGPASICCAAMAANTVDRSRSWQDLTDEAAWNCRHEPNTPYNDYVSFAELERGMSAWGLSYDLTYDFGVASSAPWSIVLCAGAVIKLADGSDFYPDSWFNYSTSPDHFICWLPQYQGSGAWVMNPLYPADTCAQVDMDSMRAAFGGAYVLHGLPTPTPPAPPDPADLPPARFEALRDFGLKPSPRSGGSDLCTVPLNAQGNDTGIRVAGLDDPSQPYARLQYGAKGIWYDGYTLGNKKYFRRL